MKNLVKLVLGIIATLCLVAGPISSCAPPDGDNDTVPSDSTARVEPPAPPKPQGIDSIAIYFDNSSSMMGYVSAKVKNDSFRNMINALGNDIKPGIPVWVYYCCNKEGAKMKLSVPEFHAATLSSKKIPQGDETPLMDITKRIVSDNRPGLLSVLVTDGILSGTNGQIREDTFYNKNHIRTLCSQLRNKLLGKDMAVSVYSFPAEFVGRFYNYTNNKLRTTPIGGLSYKYDGKGHLLLPVGTMRPLYLVAIGSPSVVKDFKRLVESGDVLPNGYKSAHAIEHLPLTTGLSPRNLNAFHDGVLSFNKKEKTMALTLSIDQIRELFPSGTDVKTISDKLIIKVNGVEKANINKEVSDDAIKFEIPLGPFHEYDLELLIPYQKPEWISQQSTKDDVKNYSNNTTFMLDKFVDALLAGVYGDQREIPHLPEYIYHQTVKLKRNK